VVPVPDSISDVARSNSSPGRRRSRGLAAGAALLFPLLAAAALPSSAQAATAAAAAQPAESVPSVAAGRPVYLTNGGAVGVDVVVRTASGAPLASPLTVRWSTGRGTAVAGRDYRASSGTLVFAAGTPSGISSRITVSTARTGSASPAKVIPIELRTTGSAVAARTTVVLNAHGLPYQNPKLPVATRVKDLLRRMTLPEKVGQMTQAERGGVNADQSQITSLFLGSLLSGGGSTPANNTPIGWADMVDSYQSRALATRLQIPLVYGVDSVHGHNNLVGATIFPHNIGMGATRDPALVRDEEHVTAIETRATGPQWVFAPCLCVARDDRWGRTYESYGEDPALVSRMETGIDGFQGTKPGDLAKRDRVLATAKHFAGDGDTAYGTSTNPAGYTLDQGIVITDWAHFARIDLSPYVPAVKVHRVGSIMPSYSSVDWTSDGIGNPIKMSANRSLLTGWLKQRMGFTGFLISDYDAILQIPGDFATQVRTSVNAGMDMFMQPFDYVKFENTLINEVRSGRVPVGRINDAVTRILTKKIQLGLFEHPFTDRRNIPTIGSPAHRAVARRAAAESQVLLKNAGGLLPLRGTERLYVAGSNADDLGNQAGGWTVTWQGQSGRPIPGTTILEGIRQNDADVTYSKDASAPTAGHDVGIVVVGETPYAEGFGDVGGPSWSDNGVPRPPKSMSLSAADQATITKVCTALPKCVVLVVSGRPQVVTDLLPRIGALVASWLPGSEGEGVADVLFGRRGFTGKLPLSWPRTQFQEPINVGDPDYRPLFPFGYGLRTRATS
jgi:beta-glucosidase